MQQSRPILPLARSFRFASALPLALSIALCSCAGTAPCRPQAQASPAIPEASPQPAARPDDPSAQSVPRLSLWTKGESRQAIEEFVAKVTDPNGPDFVPESERIATFDNDGTLWSEQPMYVQLAFTLDRLGQLADQHPEWRTKQPFRAALERDWKTLGEAGTHGILELVLATHTGMTTEEFRALVLSWLKTARHPKYGRPYTELTYAPMIELLSYLRHHGFRTFIVSGGGVDFMRPWVEAAYGIPPEQVVGTRIKAEFQEGKDGPELVRKPEIEFVDDGPGKPVGIHQVIGRRPILAAGNSDGDFQMLQWTSSGQGPRLALLLHHTDAERETAYDRESTMGRLDRALDAAPAQHWVVIDMKKDWMRVFSFEQ